VRVLEHHDRGSGERELAPERGRDVVRQRARRHLGLELPAGDLGDVEQRPERARRGQRVARRPQDAGRARLPAEQPQQLGLADAGLAGDQREPALRSASDAGQRRLERRELRRSLQQGRPVLRDSKIRHPPMIEAGGTKLKRSASKRWGCRHEGG
jgi:hypothetical protein